MPVKTATKSLGGEATSNHGPFLTSVPVKTATTSLGGEATSNHRLFSTSVPVKTTPKSIGGEAAGNTSSRSSLNAVNRPNTGHFMQQILSPYIGFNPSDVGAFSKFFY